MMTRPALFLSSCLVSVGLLATAAQAVAPTLPEGAVAVVNGQAIPRSLLNELAKARNIADVPENVDARRDMVQNLVEMELLSQRARDKGIADRLETRVEIDIAQKNMLGQLLLKKLSDEMQVDDDTLQQRYLAMPTEQEFDTSHILVADEAQAKSLIEQLQKGAKFADLARQHSTDSQSQSDGGALGPLRTSELVPAFVEAARALKPGEISPNPVHTDFGWHVILLKSKRDQVRPAFERVKPVLRMDVVSERLQAQLDQWKKEAKLTVLHAP